MTIEQNADTIIREVEAIEMYSEELEYAVYQKLKIIKDRANEIKHIQSYVDCPENMGR
jgi:hypothetical protein